MVTLPRTAEKGLIVVSDPELVAVHRRRLRDVRVVGQRQRTAEPLLPFGLASALLVGGDAGVLPRQEIQAQRFGRGHGKTLSKPRDCRYPGKLAATLSAVRGTRQT
jgi:hypothetical protein